MLEKGYSISYISKNFGINYHLLARLWSLYQEKGPNSLQKKKNFRADGHLKQKIVLDIKRNHLTLVQASLK